MTQSRGQSDLTIELSCPVCFEIFVGDHKPKNLPGCGHMVCVKCLKQMAREMKVLTCPECRKDITLPVCKCSECRKGTTLPECGVKALQTNYTIRNLAEKLVADCESSQPGMESMEMCKQHNQTMLFICLSCNKFICQICLVRKHNGHRIEEVEARFANQQDHMQNTMFCTLDKIKRGKNTVSELKKLDKQVKIAQEKEEEKIDQFVNGCIAQIMVNAQNLKTDLEKGCVKKQHKIRKAANQLERQTEQAQREYEQVADTISHFTKHQFIAQHTQFAERLQKISIRIPEINENEKSAVLFQENFDLEIKLGDLIPESKALKLEPIQTLTVFGLTPLAWKSNDQLVVVDRESFEQRIWVYHRQEGRYIVDIFWPVDFYCGEKWNPLGAVASSDGHVYIPNCDSVNIISPGGGLSIRELKVPTIADSACCVDITSDSKYVIIGNCNNASLAIYDSNDTFVRKIKTSISPMYITVIQDTIIAISDYYAGKVSVLNFVSGEELLTINIPWVRGICYEQNTDSLLVIAGGGRAIHQYCYHTGKFLSYVKSGLDSAFDMALSCDGILAVATKKHCVKIYQVHH